MTNEVQHALTLANRMLDRVNADPDDDLAILARQFLRARKDIRKAERVLERDGYRQCDIPMCNCGSWHWSPPQRADQHTQPPVSVYLPQGYATAEEFAKDCGLDLVGQPVSLEQTGRAGRGDEIEIAAHRIAHDDHVSSLCAVPDWDDLSDGRRDLLRRHAAAALGVPG